MNCIVRRLLPALMLWTAVLTFAVPSQAQDSNVRAAITVLDSTKEQDGLLGSVRRVKTESAKIELKDGRPVEGPTQLVEVTTYGIKGNRIENTSYPIRDGLVGKEEYKYDERGNITEMTVRDNHGAILSREAYNYEFDKFGNWTKMTTSLVVFENGELKREPIEVTYRTVTYYYDDTVAKIVETPTALAIPKPADQIGRGGCCHATRVGAAGWSDGAGRTFVLGNDRDGSRDASQCFGSRLRGSTCTGCRRRLHGVGQDLSDTTGLRWNCLRRRRGTSDRRSVPARFRGRSAAGKGASAVCGAGALPARFAHRQDDACGLALQTQLLCDLNRGSDDQSRSSAVHGQKDGRQDDRAQIESPIAAFPPT